MAVLGTQHGRLAAADTALGEVPRAADLVVVGAGLMGSAAAWAATRRGLSTVLLEQFALGHDRGSSHGSARIVRRAYPDPFYLRLEGRAMELEDVPSSVELRWRPDDSQATFTISS